MAEVSSRRWLASGEVSTDLGFACVGYCSSSFGDQRAREASLLAHALFRSHRLDVRSSLTVHVFYIPIFGATHTVSLDQLGSADQLRLFVCTQLTNSPFALDSTASFLHRALRPRG